MKRHKVKIGDAFTIPIGDRFAFGQVIAESIPRCYVIFDFAAPKADDALLTEYVMNGKVAILTFTMDECVRDGIWPYLFSAPPSELIHMPKYKVESLDGVYITNYAGDKLRLATKEEEITFMYRKYITPYLLEKLVRYHFGAPGEINEYEVEVYKKVLYRTNKQ